jgi:hypothetical protein
MNAAGDSPRHWSAVFRAADDIALTPVFMLFSTIHGTTLADLLCSAAIATYNATIL